MAPVHKVFASLIVLTCGALLAHGAETNAFRIRLAELQKPVAANPKNATALLSLGIYCHDVGGDDKHPDHKEAAKLGERYLNDLVKLQPTNAVATVYLGSVLTMRARDERFPFTQMALVKKGNMTMDKAVVMATNVPIVRLRRGIASFHMPGFMKREPLAREDFAWLWSKVSNDDSGLAVGDRQEVALRHGIYLARDRKKDEARAVFEAGIAFAPESADAAQLRKELEKLK